jgi:hypothetical protein
MAGTRGRKPSYDEFVRLADRHVSVHLRRLGYRRLGPRTRPETDQAGEAGAAGEGVAGSAATGRGVRRILALATGRGRRPGPPATAWLMGYAPHSEAAALLVRPDGEARAGTDGDAHVDNQEAADEVWLELTLASGEIALRLDVELPQLAARYGEADDAEVLLDPGRPLADRLERLDGILGDFVSARFRP